MLYAVLDEKMKKLRLSERIILFNLMSGSLRDFSIFYFYREKNDRMTIGEKRKGVHKCLRLRKFWITQKKFSSLEKTHRNKNKIRE